MAFPGRIEFDVWAKWRRRCAASRHLFPLGPEWTEPAAPGM